MYTVRAYSHLSVLMQQKMKANVCQVEIPFFSMELVHIYVLCCILVWNEKENDVDPLTSTISVCGTSFLFYNQLLKPLVRSGMFGLAVKTEKMCYRYIKWTPHNIEKEQLGFKSLWGNI